MLTEADFADLYLGYQKYLNRQAYELIGDASLAEDAVADAITSTFRALRRGAGPSRETFISYMKVAVRNEAIRYSKRAAQESPSDDVAEVLEQMAFGSDVWEDPEDSPWDSRAVQQAFLALPQKSQQILFRADVEGARYSVIAQEQGMAEQAVAVSAHRARDALRTSYLVARSDAAQTCGVISLEHLAQHARGKSPELRQRKIDKHLAECNECPSVVKRMLSFRIPAAAIVGIATTGIAVGGFAPGATSGASASMLSGTSVRGSTTFLSNIFRSPVALWGSAGGAVLVAAGIALTWSPSIQQFGADRVTPSASESRESDQQADAAPEDNAGQPLVPSPEGQAEEGLPDASSSPSAESPASELQVSENSSAADNTAEVPGGQTLPPGVRSVSWSDIPAGYMPGSTGSKLLLTVDFDPGTESSWYDVTVTAPAGVTVTQASAGCAADGILIRCSPTSNMLGLRSYDLQFIADVALDGAAAVPSVSITRR